MLLLSSLSLDSFALYISAASRSVLVGGYIGGRWTAAELLFVFDVRRFDEWSGVWFDVVRLELGDWEVVYMVCGCGVLWCA